MCRSGSRIGRIWCMGGLLLCLSCGNAANWHGQGDGATSSPDMPDMVDSATASDEMQEADNTDSVVDTAPVETPQQLCEGASKVIINNTPLTFDYIAPEQFVHANSLEGTIFNVYALTDAGVEVELHVDIYIGMGYSITQAPLPQTIDIGQPPEGFSIGVYVRWPRDCWPPEDCTISDLLANEFHPFTGYLMLSGSDYENQMTLQLCFTAAEDRRPSEQLQSVELFLPEVTIAGWWHAYPPP